MIVLSSEAAPYHQAEAGFKAGMADHKQMRTVLLKDVKESGIDNTIGKTADEIVAIGTPAAVFLHKSLPAPTPLIYCMVSDPVGNGFNDGRALCGVTTDVPLSAQFALISQALPKARSIGMLYRSNTPEGQRLLKTVQEALPKDWNLEAVAVDKLPNIADAIAELINKHIDIVWTSVDAQIYDYPAESALLLAALRNKVPVFGFSPAFVRSGALIGVGVSPAAQGKQAADLALRVLDHPNDAHNPRITSPEAIQIAVNLILAPQIGVELPQDVVSHATYVFKEDK